MEDTVEQAEKYYTLIGEKKIEEIKDLLDPEVEFIGPLATMHGKNAVVDATGKFMEMFRSLEIRAKFGNGHQAVIIYDVDIPGMTEKFPGASFLKFRNGKIVGIELFYDGSRFIEKKEEIFS